MNKKLKTLSELEQAVEAVSLGSTTEIYDILSVSIEDSFSVMHIYEDILSVIVNDILSKRE